VVASKHRVAFSSIASNAGARSLGEPLTTSSTSAIATARAKQNLDDADIGLLLQEMRGKAVPQRMNTGSRGSRRVRSPRAPHSHRQ
jgi:hypothetical protein